MKVLVSHSLRIAAGAFAATFCLSCTTIPAAPSGACSAEQRARDTTTCRQSVFDEILSQGLIAGAATIIPDFVAHGLTRDAGRAEDRAAAEGWRQAVPDLRMVPLRIAADCNLVAVHWEGVGTNTGEGNGLPATGRSLRVQSTFAMRDGRTGRGMVHLRSIHHAAATWDAAGIASPT